MLYVHCESTSCCFSNMCNGLWNEFYLCSQYGCRTILEQSCPWRLALKYAFSKYILPTSINFNSTNMHFYLIGGYHVHYALAGTGVYIHLCVLAVKSSQDISGLIEPQRDCVMDWRWDTHWPVTSTSHFHSWPHPFWPLPMWSALPGQPLTSTVLFLIHPYSLSLPTHPSQIDFSNMATAGSLLSNGFWSSSWNILNEPLLLQTNITVFFFSFFKPEPQGAIWFRVKILLEACQR